MCDSIVAAPDETAAGFTLYAKNSDRKGHECLPFVQLPEAWHPARARVRIPERALGPAVGREP